MSPLPQVHPGGCSHISPLRWSKRLLAYTIVLPKGSTQSTADQPRASGLARRVRTQRALHPSTSAAYASGPASQFPGCRSYAEDAAAARERITGLLPLACGAASIRGRHRFASGFGVSVGSPNPAGRCGKAGFRGAYRCPARRQRQCCSTKRFRQVGWPPRSSVLRLRPLP